MAVSLAQGEIVWLRPNEPAADAPSHEPVPA
jgi:hypothetical protein